MLDGQKILAFGVAMLVSLCASFSLCAGENVWLKAYGLGGEESAGKVVATDDGGCAFVGGNCCTRLAPDGSVEWLRRIESAYITSLAATPDGGYIASGNSDYHGSWACKLDSGGNILWVNSYSPFAGSPLVVTAPGGGAVLCLRPMTPHGAVVIKLDSEGRVLSRRVYKKDDYAQPYAMAPTADGGLVMAGRQDRYNPPRPSCWILKLSVSGTVEWQRGIGSSASIFPYDIQPSPDGGYFLSGTVYDDNETADALLLRLDASGQTVWQRAWGGSDAQAYSVLPMEGGGCIVAGSLLTPDYASSLSLLLIFDSNGLLTYQGTMGGGKYDTALSLALSGSDIIACGKTDLFGPTRTSAWVMRMPLKDGHPAPCRQLDDPALEMRTHPLDNKSGPVAVSEDFTGDTKPVSPRTWTVAAIPYTYCTNACTLSCGSSATPLTGAPPLTVAFGATAEVINCQPGPTFDWDFGDGSPGSSEQNPSHIYSRTGAFPWRVTVSQGGLTCVRTGTIHVTDKSRISFAKKLVTGFSGSKAWVAQAPGGDIFMAAGSSADESFEDIWVARLDGDGIIDWQKRLGGPARELLWGFEPTPDGGIILLGTTLESQEGLNGPWLAKFSSKGDMQWQKRYEEYLPVTGCALSLAAEGGFLLAGYRGGPFALRVDETGSILWQTWLQWNWNDESMTACQTPDGGFAIAGEGGWVLKLTSSGQVAWLKDYDWGAIYDIRPAPQGGLIAVGRSSQRKGDVWAMRLGPAGEVFWEWSYGTFLDEAGYGVEVAEDGGCSIVGCSKEDSGVTTMALLLELDPEGRLQWSAGYGDGMLQPQTWSHCRMEDGGLFVGGTGGWPWGLLAMRFAPGGMMGGSCPLTAVYEMEGMALSPQEIDTDLSPRDDLASSAPGQLARSDAKLAAEGICWDSTCGLSCTASQSSISGTEPLTVSFVALATPSLCYREPEYRWDFGDGTTSLGPSVEHTYAKAGLYGWQMTSSADGVTCSQSGQVQVSTDCLISCQASTAPARATAPAIIRFSAEANLTNCEEQATFLWDFGDGSSSCQADPVHIYGAPGTFEWSVTASAMGVSASRGGTIQVDAAPAETWSRTYSKPWQDFAGSICQLADGSFALAGYSTGMYGESTYYASLLMLSSGGSPSWMRLYGGEPTECAFSSVSPAPDGGLFLAGRIYPSGGGDSDLMAMKLTAGGEILWQKAYGTPLYESLSATACTDDGLILIGGGYLLPYESPYSFVVNLDAWGNIRWLRGLGAGSLNYTSSVTQADDGAFLILGSIKDPEAVPWVGKLDTTGNFLWQKSYRMEGADSYEGGFLCPASGGGALVFNHPKPAEGAGGIWALRLDCDGEVGWQRFYQGEYMGPVASAKQLSDGGFFFATRSSPYFGGGGWLVRLDPAGELLWQRQFDGYFWDAIECATPTADGGFAMVGGLSFSSYEHSDRDLWMVKTGPDGHVGQGCPVEYSPSATASIPTAVSGITSVTLSDTSISEKEATFPIMQMLPAANGQCGSNRTPPQRAGHAFLRLGDKILLFGGEVGDAVPDAVLTYYSDTWIYDLSSRAWEELHPADAPAARSFAAAAECGGKGYIFFGGDGQATAIGDIWAFDPEVGDWSMVVPKSAGPKPGKNYAAASTGGAIFLLVGDGNELWRFDPPSATWVKRAQFPGSSISGAAIATIKDKIVCFIGQGAYCENGVWLYDVGGDTWEAVPVPFLDPRPSASSGLACATDGELLWVFGGACDYVTYYDVWSFDPSTKTWTSRSPLPKARKNAGVAWIGGGGGGTSFLLFGGQYSSSVYLYPAYVGDTLVYSKCQLIFGASAAPASGTAPLEVSFSASAISVEGCSSQPDVRWSFGDGATSDLMDVAHTYTAPGTYPWKFEANHDGAAYRSSGTVSISPPACQIDAAVSISAERGSAPMAVEFSAEVTSSGCATPAQAEWSFGEGSTSTGNTARHIYYEPGIYRWEFRASAGNQNCSRAGEIIALGSICNMRCPATATPARGIVPLTVYFDSHISSDGCPTPSGASWNFGDGEGAGGWNATHTYSVPGVFAWTFSAETEGKQCSAGGSVHVAAISPGDCDSNGTVSIGEVQKAINMFLGTLAPDCGVDCGGDGKVAIGELQKVINAFLGLQANC